MATTDAIAAVSDSLIEVLRQARATAPAGITLTETSFKHASSTTLATPPDGVTLWLYRLGPSQSRNRPVTRFAPTGERLRPSLLLDLHYLLTAWQTDPLHQQQLLGWCVRVLEDAAILPGGLLDRSSFPAVFELGDQLELVWETVAWADQATIWNIAQSKLAPSATYVVRNVPIDSQVIVDEGPPVQTRTFDLTTAVGPIGAGS